MDDELPPMPLGTADAAYALGVSPRAFCKLVDQKILPSWKIGQFRRVEVEDLKEYLTNHGVPHTRLQAVLKLRGNRQSALMKCAKCRRDRPRNGNRKVCKICSVKPQ